MEKININTQQENSGPPQCKVANIVFLSVTSETTLSQLLVGD